MSGSRNCNQIAIELNLVLRFDYPFYPQPPGAIACVHDPFTTKLFGEPSVIGNVVLMTQKHFPDAAHRGDLLYQLRGKTWRINQDVTTFGFGPQNQITPGAKTRLRSEAAEIDILSDGHRESIDARAKVLGHQRPDRSSGTGDQSHQRAPCFCDIRRLMKDDRGVAG